MALSTACFRQIKKFSFLALLFLVFTNAAFAKKEPLKVGYSDWPGWVAWEVAIQKDWFKEAGVDVEFIWFDYVASMDAFVAGKIDAVCVTNGDALVTGATGGANVMILVNDYSNGNDMVVAQPGYKNLKELKGKKIGVEIGFVDHLLLLNGLEKAGLKESDITLVNVATSQAAQTLASKQVEAVAAWQPNSGQALKMVPGSKAIYSSADEPGLIYDMLTVSPSSLSKNKTDWEKVVKVWYKVVEYISNPKTMDDAVKIMANRVGLKPEVYKELMKGTKLLTLNEAKKVMQKGSGFGSVYGSSEIVDKFQVENKVYKSAQKIDKYIYPDIILNMK